MSTQVAERPQADPAPPAEVEGVLNFAERSAEKPYPYTYKPPEGVPATNITTTAQAVKLKNARTIASGLDVDVQGFQIVSHHTAVRDFWDEAQTLALGHPEIAELVKAVT